MRFAGMWLARLARMGLAWFALTGFPLSRMRLTWVWLARGGLLCSLSQSRGGLGRGLRTGDLGRGYFGRVGGRIRFRGSDPAGSGQPDPFPDRPGLGLVRLVPDLGSG